jgi:hypothetical protein
MSKIIESPTIRVSEHCVRRRNALEFICKSSNDGFASGKDKPHHFSPECATTIKLTISLSKAIPGQLPLDNLLNI